MSNDHNTHDYTDPHDSYLLRRADLKPRVVGYWVLTASTQPSLHIQGQLDGVACLRTLHNDACAAAREQATRLGILLPADVTLEVQKYAPPISWRDAA